MAKTNGPVKEAIALETVNQVTQRNLGDFPKNC